MTAGLVLYDSESAAAREAEAEQASRARHGDRPWEREFPPKVFKEIE